MNLVWFLTIAAIFSIILGEFGQFPFGNVSSSISLTDILLLSTLVFFLIWKIGIQRNIKLPKIFYFIIGFWIVGGISLLVSKEFSGGLYLLRFIIYSLSFLVGFYVVKSKNLNLLFKTIIYSVLGFAVLGMLQILIFPDISMLTDLGFDPHKNRMVSTLLDPNFLGIILNISLILSLYFLTLEKKLKWVIITGFLGISIFLTFSRSAYLAFLIPIIVFGIFKLKKLLVISAVVIALLFLFIPQFNQRVIGAFQVDKSASERIGSWRRGLVVFNQYPVLGVGFNNLRSAYSKNNLFKVFSPDGGHSGAGVDSSFILVLATTGVIGGAIYLSFWLTILYKLIRYRKLINRSLNLTILSLILALVINSQFINSLFFPPVMLLTYLILGGFWAASTKKLK